MLLREVGDEEPFRTRPLAERIQRVALLLAVLFEDRLLGRDDGVIDERAHTRAQLGERRRQLEGDHARSIPQR